MQVEYFPCAFFSMLFTFFLNICKILIYLLQIWPRQIDDLEGAKKAANLFGYPLMIKSKRLAYDGRGNAVARSEEELSSAISGKLIII